MVILSDANSVFIAEILAAHSVQVSSPTLNRHTPSQVLRIRPKHAQNNPSCDFKFLPHASQLDKDSHSEGGPP